ncbi:hypothetical protein EUGRSUZ_J01118 [Eucalyptus grandis]|uniref:Uncharacterized protein n=2 Tax=Eucalyptus grandis TaxID=71139 RepID=A0ACC3J4D5_EUCGR|nr:hypothetical protein EUGRSUZ_J01118 [Eucalyptus grandis]
MAAEFVPPPPKEEPVDGADPARVPCTDDGDDDGEDALSLCNLSLYCDAADNSFADDEASTASSSSSSSSDHDGFFEIASSRCSGEEEIAEQEHSVADGPEKEVPVVPDGVRIGEVPDGDGDERDEDEAEPQCREGGIVRRRRRGREERRLRRREQSKGAVRVAEGPGIGPPPSRPCVREGIDGLRRARVTGFGQD